MNLNRAEIIGRLTQAPAIKTLEGGTTVATFGVATNRTWKDKNGDKQEEVEYHNIVAYGNIADNAGKFLGRGDEAMITGRIQTRKWKHEDGTTASKTEIVAESIQFGAKTGQGRAGGGHNEERAETEAKAPPRAKTEATGAGKPLGPGYMSANKYPEPGKDGNPQPDDTPF